MAGPDGLGRDIVLALLVERSGSAYALEKRLRERFAGMGYSEGIARSAVEYFRRNGLARTVPSSESRSSYVWEATPLGVERSREWLEAWEDSAARDELWAKLVLCEPEHIPRLVERMIAGELRCAAEVDRVEAELGVSEKDSPERRRRRIEWSWWSSRLWFVREARATAEGVPRRQNTP